MQPQQSKIYTHSLCLCFAVQQKLIAIYFIFYTPGIKLEALDTERALEEAGILNDEIIGVVFKNNFSYHLRFPAGNVVFPNENLEYIGTQLFSDAV